MNRFKWRQLASSLVVATLSLGIAACDDDTTSNGGDMAVSQDMSASADMGSEAAGTGQVTLADLVGTAYSGTTVAPRTHVLLTIASFPKPAGESDPSSDLNLSTFSGCTINRYNASNPPGTDGDAGLISISGYNNMTTLALNTKTGSTQPTPSSIGCMRVQGHYVCGFGGMMAPDGGAMGALTGDVIFPMIPNRCVLAATLGSPGGPTTCPAPGSTNLGWPSVFPCNPRYVPNPQDPSCSPDPTACTTLIEMCEQQPMLVPYNIHEQVAGGTDFMASDQMVKGGSLDSDGGIANTGNIFVVSITQGSSTTSIAGTDPITKGPSLSMDNPIDASKTLTITYSCDGSATPGAGCSGTSNELAALLVRTSTTARNNFAAGTTMASGVAQCITPVGNSSHSITIKANQLTALLGGQTGGSIQLALARLKLALANTQPLIVSTAGLGSFGFTNQ